MHWRTRRHNQQRKQKQQLGVPRVEHQERQGREQQRIDHGKRQHRGIGEGCLAGGHLARQEHQQRAKWEIQSKQRIVSGAQWEERGSYCQRGQLIEYGHLVEDGKQQPKPGDRDVRVNEHQWEHNMLFPSSVVAQYWHLYEDLVRMNAAHLHGQRG